MDYGNILSRAWQIVWKYKILWIFGILASFVQAGTSSGTNISYRFSSGDVGQGVSNLFGNVSQNTLIALGLMAAVVLLVLWLVAIFLGTLGVIGLVRGTLQADAGAQSLVFADLFSNSMPFFWRVLGLNVLAFLVIIILSPIIGLLAVCTCGIGFIALVLFIQVYLQLANIGIVVENRGIMDALGRSWELIRSHFGDVLVMAILLGVVGFLVTLILGIPLFLTLGPVIVVMITGAVTGTKLAIPGGAIAAGLCFLAYLPVLLILSGILRAFLTASWTLTYQRLAVQPAALGSLPAAT
jgi:hypothetical protein